MTHQEITHDQASKLAAFVSAIRDDWDTPGLMKAFETARLRVGVTPADIGIAAIKAAANPKNRTPAIIALPGDHWREHVRPLETPLPPHRCPNCGNEISYAEPHTCIRTRIGDHRTGIDAVRTAHDEVKAQLCPHGVKWRDCKQHEEAS